MAFDDFKGVNDQTEITSLSFEQFNQINYLRHIKDSIPDVWQKVQDRVLPPIDGSEPAELFRSEKEHLIEAGILTENEVVIQHVQDYIRNGLTDLTLPDLFRLREDLVETQDGEFVLKTVYPDSANGNQDLEFETIEAIAT